MTYPYLFPAMWLLWAGYWWLSSHDAKRTERSESQASRLMHIVPLMLAALLLIVDRWPLPILLVRIYPWAAWEFWAGAAVTAAGLLFSVWARVHIGRNWSGIVTLKHDHDLVVTGPYQIVRHPIYAGLLVALVGSAFACGQWRGVLALVFALLAVSRKVAIEERWMRERFREKYDAYSRSVPALVPRMRRS